MLPWARGTAGRPMLPLGTQHDRPRHAPRAAVFLAAIAVWTGMAGRRFELGHGGLRTMDCWLSATALQRRYGSETTGSPTA